MNKDNGITIIELIIAISLLSLAALTAGGIYLSGWNMFREAQYRSQSQRNAMVPLMHMIRNLKRAVRVEQSGSNLQYTVYPVTGNWTTAVEQYQFDNSARLIKYINNDGDEQIIGSHIVDAQFSISHDSSTGGIITSIYINADDSRDQGDFYTIETAVSSAYGPAEEAL